MNFPLLSFSFFLSFFFFRYFRSLSLLPSFKFFLHLSGHTDDVFDLSWAPDGSALASASLENTVLVWDTPVGGGAPPPPSSAAAAPSPSSSSHLLAPLPAVGNGGRPRARHNTHSHYVQGVSWDPTGALLASASADRSVKIYKAAAEVVGKKKKRTLEKKAAERAAAVAAAEAAGLPVPLPPPRPPLAASADRLACAATLQRRLAAPAEVPGALANAAAHAAATAAAGGGGAPPPPPLPPLPRLPLFMGEELPSFFRRLGWAPDGSCLIVPAGLLHPGAAAAAAAANATAASAAAAAGAKGKTASMPPPPPPQPNANATTATAAGTAAAPLSLAIPATPQHGAFIYARGEWGAPAAALPSVKPTVAVKFCPVLFALEEKKDEGDKTTTTAAAAAPSPQQREENEPAPQQQQPPPLFDLPYRLVFAVASLDSVAVYESNSLKPLAFLGALHPEPITDVAWSCDGRFLAVSSYDGYCSVAAFAPGELGTPLEGGAGASSSSERKVVPDFVWRRVASQAKALSVTPSLPAAAVPATPAAAAMRPPPSVPVPAPVPQQQQAGGGGGGPRRLVPEPVVAAAPSAAAAAAGPRRIAPTPLSGSGSLPSAPAPAAPAAVAPEVDTRRRIAPQPMNLGGPENAAPTAVVAAVKAAAAPASAAPGAAAPAAGKE